MDTAIYGIMESFGEVFNLANWRLFQKFKTCQFKLNACAPLTLYIHLGKFKFQVRAVSPNLMLTKPTCYRVVMSINNYCLISQQLCDSTMCNGSIMTLLPFIIGVSRSEPHTYHSCKKIAVLVYVCMYVCTYVCMYVTIDMSSTCSTSMCMR